MSGVTFIPLHRSDGVLTDSITMKKYALMEFSLLILLITLRAGMQSSRVVATIFYALGHLSSSFYLHHDSLSS